MKYYKPTFLFDGKNPNTSEARITEWCASVNVASDILVLRDRAIMQESVWVTLFEGFVIVSDEAEDFLMSRTGDISNSWSSDLRKGNEGSAEKAGQACKQATCVKAPEAALQVRQKKIWSL